MAEQTKKVEVNTQRPLILELKSAKIDLVSCINSNLSERHIPAFLMRGIVDEVLNSLKEVEQKEYELAEKQYAESLKESQK